MVILKLGPSAKPRDLKIWPLAIEPENPLRGVNRGPLSVGVKS